MTAQEVAEGMNSNDIKSNNASSEDMLSRSFRIVSHLPHPHESENLS
jgi:hypothetical protein